MIIKPKISSLIASQLPEFVREDHQTFVQFLKAYYDYLGSQTPDIKTVRDIDTTLNSFIKHFKNELAANLPSTVVSERFLLQHIKEQYLSKGSEESFKLLFKLLYNKNVTVEYPAKQMLRASDGKWNQDVSIICRIINGHPDQVVGKLIDVITPNKIIRVLIDRRQYVEVEIERVVEIAPDIFEFYVDRRFFGDISIGDRIRYQTEDIYFSAEILATTAKLQILEPGTGFRVGQLYSVRNGAGYGSIMKVTKTNSAGGLTSAEFIKFGTGYGTDFTSTIYPELGQSSAGIGGTSLQIIGLTVAITESTDGFSETGVINKADYSMDAVDGTYAGEVLREFGNQEAFVASPFDPAVIKISLGPLGKYPGYYTNNDGFLDDAIFIQDSRYYQAFSYTLKIDERLDVYKSAVKSLVHPAGMAIFGEYDIRNEFDIGLELESMIKILAVNEQDDVVIDDSHTATLVVSKALEDILSPQNSFISTKGFGKALDDSTSYSDDISTKGFGKALNSSNITPGDVLTTRDFGKALEDFPIATDSISARNISKSLVDTSVVIEIPYLAVTKYIDPAISGVDAVSESDSGYIIVNPYAEAGWFLEDYVGVPLNF